MRLPSLRKFRVPCCILPGAVLCVCLHGQEEPSTPAGDVIDLPEFVVQSDEGGGYLKTNTISATRLNQRVKDLPMPVEIITSDFITDTGAETLGEALSFSAGLELNLTSTLPGDNTAGQETSFRLRGLIQEAALRNGFRKVGAVDTFNITQVDVVRGPNALLYGVGNFGGVVNYSTRRPSAEPRYGMSFSVDSENSYRFTSDATGPITKNLRYSLSTVLETGEAWYDHFERDKYGIAPVVEWQPFKGTTLTLDLEYLRQDTTGTENPFRKSSLDNAYRIPEGGTGLERVPYIELGAYPVVDPDSGEPVPLANQLGFLRFPGGDDEFRWIADNQTRREDYGIMLNWVQDIGDDFSFQAGYYYTAEEIEGRSTILNLTNANSFLAGLSDEQRAQLEADLGGENWLVSEVDPNNPDPRKDPFGKVLTYNWTDTGTKEERHQFRLEGAYNLPVHHWWKNIFTFGATYNEFQIFDDGDGRLRRFDKATLPPDDPDRWEPGDNVNTRYLDAYTRVQSIYDPTPITLDPRDGEFFARAFGPSDGPKFREFGAYFIHQGNFLDDRLHTVAGLRYDKSGVRRPVRDFNANTLSLTDWQEPPSATNFSFGVSGRPRKDSPWAVYFLTAGAVKPEFGRNDAAGNVLPPTDAQSLELGLKYDFFDAKISGTIAVYEVERTGVIVSSNELIRPVEGDPGFNPDIDYQRNGLRDDLSRGVDMQTIITDLPFRNLQTVINFSYNDFEISDFSGLSFEDPVPDDRPGVTPKTFIQKDLTSSLPDRRNNDSPEFTVKIWTKYEFREGPLRGFDVALGFRWEDEREVYLNGRPEDAIQAASFILEDPQSFWDLAFGYKNKFRGVRYNIRLNFQNLNIDEGDTFGYSFLTPRSARLSVSANF